MTTEMLTGIGIICTLLTVLVNGYFQNQRENRKDALAIKNRELDLAERQAAASATRVQVKGIGDHLATKIEENTQISVKAFDVANNVNDKIATIAGTASEHAVTSMNDVMNELGAIKRMLTKK